MDGGLHWIRPLRNLIGEIESVCSIQKSYLSDMEGESLSHSLLKFENGHVGTLDCLVSSGPLIAKPFYR
eukprot:UN10661